MRTFIFLVCLIGVATVQSCGEPKVKGCIEAMMEEEGYSYEDAKEACEEASRETIMRRD